MITMLAITVAPTLTVSWRRRLTDSIFKSTHCLKPNRRHANVRTMEYSSQFQEVLLWSKSSPTNYLRWHPRKFIMFGVAVIKDGGATIGKVS